VKEIFIDRGITQSRVAVLQENKIIDLYIENHAHTNITGNIYKGRIENVVPGLNAAFVNIGTSKNAILHFDDIEDKKEIKRGEDILVQVIREPIKDKGARVSNKISIPGKYVVLLPNTNYIGISQKISDEKLRRKFLRISNEIHSKGYGFIIRTEAISTSEEELTSDYIYLKEMWENINKRINYIKSPQILFNAKDFYNFIIREYLKADVDKIYVNRKQDEQYLIRIVEGLNQNKNSSVYFNEFDFSKINYLEQQIVSLIDGKVNLPSGGYLIIDQTEAFNIIDVNTGSYTTNENQEETILKTNFEACEEIFKIIKLRNLSGIILVDFIDMKEEQNKELILNTMKDYFKNDKVSNRIYGFTGLGILEMSRAKKGKRLSELIYKNEQVNMLESSYCLKKIENTCARISKHYGKKDFKVFAAPYIIDDIQNTFSSFSSEMKNIYNININFVSSNIIDSYYIEDKKDEVEFAKVELGNKAIFGRLVSFMEDRDGNVTLTIKKV
jgi:ribonuclease G